MFTFFLTRPRFFSYFEVSIEVARRRADLPGLASGLIIHQDDLPVPSFCTRMNRLCSDKLWRIEFYSKSNTNNGIISQFNRFSVHKFTSIRNKMMNTILASVILLLLKTATLVCPLLWSLMNARDVISGGWVWGVVAKPPFKNPLVIYI